MDQVSSLESIAALSTHNKCFLLHLILGQFFQEHENSSKCTSLQNSNHTQNKQQLSTDANSGA